MYEKKAWHLVPKTPSPQLVEFLKRETQYLCIVVDVSRVDIEALAQETGLRIARSESDYREITARMFNEKVEERFLIPESVIWGCQNWEQAYQRKDFHVYRDRRQYLC